MEPLFDVKLIALLPAVNVLVMLILPDPAVALLSVILMVPTVLLMTFNARALVLSVKLMLPLVLLLAAKLVTEFVAAFNVVPVAELVVSKPPVITPDPPMEPLFDVKLMALLPVFKAAVTLMLPDPAVALLSVMLMVPTVSLIAFKASALALSIKLMLPLVPLLAAKLVIEFVVAFNVVPVAELVVSKPLVIAPV